MATLYPVPKELAIEALLAGLVSVPTHVRRTEAEDPSRDTTGVFAEFVTDDDELAVLGFVDHAAVNFVGGAMLDVAAETLVDASGKGVIDDDSLEGFREVLNIFASCLNSDFTKHLRLRTVQPVPGQLSDDVKQLWREPRGRRAYQVAVDDLGTGTLILYLG